MNQQGDAFVDLNQATATLFAVLERNSTSSADACVSKLSFRRSLNSRRIRGVAAGRTRVARRSRSRLQARGQASRRAVSVAVNAAWRLQNQKRALELDVMGL